MATARDRDEPPPGDVPRVALVGGAKLSTESLSWLLSGDGNLVVGAYPNAASLLSSSAPPDVVLIDGDDPEAGVTAVSEIRLRHPQLSLVLLLSAITPAAIRAAIDEPIQAVVLKTDSSESVLSALRHVLSGRSVLPAGWQQALESDLLGGLSPREREILELVAAGMTNEEIGKQLFISVNTVKFHLRAVYTRLGVRNRVEAMRALGVVKNGHHG